MLDKSGKAEPMSSSPWNSDQSTEVHSMRYLFLPEIAFLAAQTDFPTIEWISDKSLEQQCWSGYVMARATDDRK
jgi:hypothetical protein